MKERIQYIYRQETSATALLVLAVVSTFALGAAHPTGWVASWGIAGFLMFVPTLSRERWIMLPAIGVVSAIAAFRMTMPIDTQDADVANIMLAKGVPALAAAVIVHLRPRQWIAIVAAVLVGYPLIDLLDGAEFPDLSTGMGRYWLSEYAARISGLAILIISAYKLSPLRYVP